MSGAVTSWDQAYGRLIGKSLERAAFMPISCDTPHVVDDLAKPALWFSGAMCLAFMNEPEVFLTWAQAPEPESGNYILASVSESAWTRRVLDRIGINNDLPWLTLVDATLRRVSLLSVSTDAHSKIVAARHDFEGERGRAGLWVGTYDAHSGCVDEGDDLYVGVDAPSNVRELISVRNIGDAP
jgi:hypothetical protein